MFEFTTAPTIEELRKDHENFNYIKMQWGPWQTPRNLLLALIGELGELSEDVVANVPGNINSGGLKEDDVTKDGTKIEDVLAELTDVCCYLVCLASECQVDIANLSSPRDDNPSSAFTNTSWKDIQVKALSRTNFTDEYVIGNDFLKLFFSASEVKDIFQWTIVDKKLANLSRSKQEDVDKYIKDIFCHIVVLASKYEFDLPKLVRDKNIRTAEKYSESVGVLTKDDVINNRFGHLPCFYGFPDAKELKVSYYLDKPVKNCVASSNKLVCELIISIGLIAEVFQWDTDGPKREFSQVKHAHLTHQMCRITNGIRSIAQVHNISLSQVFREKMQKNRLKYPLSASRCAFQKYSENMESKEESINSHALHCNQPMSTISDAAAAMKVFVDEREWHEYHANPRNLTLALFGEIGEVTELFVWENSKDFISCLGDELSDCLAYLVRLASCCEVELPSSLDHYFPQ